MHLFSACTVSLFLRTDGPIRTLNRSDETHSMVTNNAGLLLFLFISEVLVAHSDMQQEFSQTNCPSLVPLRTRGDKHVFVCTPTSITTTHGAAEFLACSLVSFY